VSDHVTHARAYSAAERLGRSPIVALDLGSGAGVPGLVLAMDLPESTWVLLDASARRTAWLSAAVAELELEGRARVVTDRAEVIGRDLHHRGSYDVVVARSFGPPAVVAECAAPLLVTGGRLLVSEPPVSNDRWPAEALAPLGLRLVAFTASVPRIATLSSTRPCPERFPRRAGIPAKRPLW
jgi:16S rRNA (guanine527-N7)-methyltransferase